MIKLIALDMDGTLLNDDSRISDENRNWIHRAEEAGILVCLATGRGIQSVSPYLDELEMQAPIVTVNGGEVWEHRGSLWQRHTMKPDWIAQLRELAMEYDVWYWAYTTEGPFNRETWIEGELSEYTWLKFGYYTEDEEVRSKLFQEVASYDQYEHTNSHPCNMELNPKGVNKANGLKEICRRLKISMAEVAAAGDSLNDMAMIRECGFGVAMGNAQQAVKDVADWITDTNVDHGVATFIRKVLEER